LGPRRNRKRVRPRIKGRKLERSKPFLNEGKTILIVCEDSKASPDYFKKLRNEFHLGAVNVEVCGEQCGSAPISVVNFAEDKKNEVTSTVRGDYDEIFCVVDVDEHPSLQDAIQKANANDIELIISNPCFEYWHLLHFEKTSKAYTRRDALYSQLKAHLKKKGFRGDIKNGCKFFEIVYPLRKTAIKNSKAVLNSHWHNEEDLSKCNPSTAVHRVVECIMDMANKT